MLEQNIQDYISRYSSPQSRLLADLERETLTVSSNPQMMSPPTQGRRLSLFSKLVAPRRILEIGTFTGYSALCLAEGLTADGELHTLDIDTTHKSLVEKYVALAGESERIKLHYGDAIELISNFQNTVFDLIFIDANKSAYTTYYALSLPLLRSGGLMLIDNTLWKGKVAEEDLRENDNITRHIHNLNVVVAEDDRVEKVILLAKDGLSVIRKI